MTLFAAILTYTDDTERIASVRPTHREYLSTLLEDGKLYKSGPFGDDSGSLIIYEADDIATAQEYLANDPFTTNGIIVGAQLREWKLIFERDGH